MSATVNISDITERYLNFNNGFFIEVGAANGIFQSNTHGLETSKNWRGILIEPNTAEYQACISNRPNSKVYNCALVGYEYGWETVKMNYRTWNGSDHGAVTSVSDSSINPIWGAHTSEYTIRARTLDSILEEEQVGKIDFFSLDVEGYELNVLKGFNIAKYKPSFVLVEVHPGTNQLGAIKELMGDYDVEQVSAQDYLFKYKG